MKILIITPTLRVYGGIRIILEWANRLIQWNEVYLYNQENTTICDWFTFDPKLKLVKNDNIINSVDCLIITNPNGMKYANYPNPRLKVIFMQMVEHLFMPNNKKWLIKCNEFYSSRYPMIAISQWNIDMVKKDFNRVGKTHYVGNGISFKDFPIENELKDNKTVLVEGWEPANYCKDELQIGPKVAKRLKADGYKIIAYSQHPLKTLTDIPNEYYYKPDLKKMNELYKNATILVKATRYDARSLSPLEAMTKGTVTARAIINGDDDLIHEYNCLRCDYNREDELYDNAKLLLTDVKLRNRLSLSCLEHVANKCSWNHWMPVINYILNKSFIKVI